MLRFFKFHASVRDPVPAREIYVRHEGGRGWPEECPPLRAANAFGWDVLVTHPMIFHRKRDGSWRLEGGIDVESDWAWRPADTRRRTGDEPAPSVTQTQRNAWFWEKGQTLPHPISDDVYLHLRNQVKITTWLYLETDPGEQLFITDIPNLPRSFRVLTALVDTDRYPASYPWHCVIELDPRKKTIEFPAGLPLCRLFTVPRATYEAKPMTPRAFGRYFDASQRWLLTHGKGPPAGMMDITRAYLKERRLSRFKVGPS